MELSSLEPELREHRSARRRGAYLLLREELKRVLETARGALIVMQISMPVITRILETALYVDDLDAVVAFYRDILGLRVLDASPRLVSLDAGQATVLLLFRRGATVSGLDTSSGWIPPHDGQGPVHLAFAIATEALGVWELRLQDRGVAIESRVRWDRGGQSIYFRDPAGHSVELATPGTWAVY